MEEQRPYWNMEMESKLNTPEMKEFQWKWHVILEGQNG